MRKNTNAQRESLPPLSARKDSAPPMDWSGVRPVAVEQLPRVAEAASDSVRDLDELTRIPTRMSSAFEAERLKLRMQLNLEPEALPLLWDDDAARREDYDDEATEVAPWSKFIRLPDDTLRDLREAEARRTPKAPTVEAAVEAPATPVARVSFPPKRATPDLSSILEQLRAIDRRLRRTDRFIVAGGIILVAIVITAFAAFRHASRQKPPAVEGSAPAAPAPLASEADKDSVEVFLSASPSFARFQIDQGPILDAPWTGRVPRDDQEHDVLVSADGYFARVVKMRFTRDAGLEVALQRVPDFGPPTAPIIRPRAARPAPGLPAPAPTPEPKPLRIQTDPGDPWAR